MTADAMERGVMSRAVTLPFDPRSAGAARSFVRRTIRDWQLVGAVDPETAALCTSEVVTNALENAGSTETIQLVVECQACELLHVAVRDHCTGEPQESLVGSGATSGRGLFLVDTLSDRWGFQPRQDGEIGWEVSFDFRLAMAS